jgi:glycine betaine/choline ABC-type transport system substrate-binding protein
MIPRLVTIAMALCLSGCAPAATDAVRIGGKNFTEQLVLAEILAQHVERSGRRVQRVPGFGGTALVHQALISGDLDVYVEYSGTAWQVNLKEPPAALETLRARYAERFRCQVLSPLGFHNGYALISRKPATGTLSDLAMSGRKLRAGFNAEFLGRPDGWVLARDAYGLAFASIATLDAGLIYRALDDRRVDVVSGFTTDARLASMDYHVFADDRALFPRYDAVTVVHAEALTRHPGLAETLETLAGTLDDATMRKLNHAADVEHRPIPEIARDFLDRIHGGKNP